MAKELGVDESTLRRRLARRHGGAVDGRKGRAEACDAVASIIEAWMARREWDGVSFRPVSIKSLYEDRVSEHGCVGVHKAVQRFVRRRAPAPKLRPVRRVETRPGRRSRSARGVLRVFVHDMGGVSPLKAYLVTLSQLRMDAVRFYLDA